MADLVKAREPDAVFKARELIEQQKAGVLITSASYAKALDRLLYHVSTLNEKLKIWEGK